MLVLSRKTGEQVLIGAGIEVTVLAIQGSRVRLGISGPPEVTIHREEVHRRISAGPSESLAARSRKTREVG